MKKLIIIFFVLLLTACASPERAKYEEFQRWRSINQQQAQSGALKWSSFYSDAYYRMSQFSPNPEKALAERMMAEMIPIARKYEAGEMTKQAFEDIQRLVLTKYQSINQNNQQIQQQINDIQAQQLYQLGNQIMQPRNPTTNCLTTRVGPNTLSTNCN